MKTARGAEAELQRDEDTVVKQRIAKGYRHPQIDQRLREERTANEQRLLEKAAQAGVRVPAVDHPSSCTLHLEYIQGRQMKEVFEQRDDLWPTIGTTIGRLHARDIIHGDLTTSNMLVTDDKLYLIDFGLGFFSQRVEDRATDLRLLEQVLQATHYDVADTAFDTILDGYREMYDGSEDVIDQLADMRSRRRYS